MLEVKVYNKQGKEIGKVDLNPKIFNVKPEKHLLHQVLITQLSNRRQATASTKDRGDVRGGGKKPWRQKGTGRARHGSIRSPLWKGGGVVFGPTPDRNYKKKINKKMKRKALFMALTSKVKDKLLVIIDELKLEKIKTKDLKSLLDKLPIKETVSIALPKNDEKIIKSARNLPYVDILLADSLNIVDLLKNESLLLTKESLKIIEKTYLQDNRVT